MIKNDEDKTFGPQKNSSGFFRPHHHPAPDFRWAFRILKISKIWIISTVLVSASLAVLNHIFEQETYTSGLILALNTQSHMNPISESLGLSNNDNFMPKVYSLVEQFKSPEACNHLIQAVGTSLEEQKFSKSVVANAGESICSGLSFQPDFEKFQIRIASRMDDPILSEIIANTAGTIFIENDQKRLRRKISELKRFLSQQEKELGRQVRQIETEKALFQASSSVISVNQAEKSIVERLEKSEQDYLEIQVQLKNNENLIQQSKVSLRELKKALTNPDSTLSSLYLNQIQYRLNMLQYRKSMLKGQNDPDGIAKVDTEISQIMKVYQQALDGKGDTSLSIGGDPIEYLKTLKNSYVALLKDRESLKSRALSIDDNLKKKGMDLKELASSMQRLGELNRENEVANNLYLVIKKRLQEIEIEEAASVSDFAVLSRASRGASQNSSLSKKVLFYSGIGLFCCLALLLIQNSVIPTVKDLNDIEQLGLTALGYIPLAPINPLSKLPILLKEYPDSIDADAFRALRLRLQAYKNISDKQKTALVILVTSPGPGAGKTFVSSNLAFAFAKGNIKTLMIDLDLRQPSVKKYFDSTEIKGKLNESIDFDKLKSYIETYNSKLDILAPTEPVDHPAEFIEKIQLSKFIEEVKGDYDFIIIDVPPVLSVIDPFLVTSTADLHLLIVEHRKTHRDDIINSVELLSELKTVPILGLMNKAHPGIIYADSGKYYVITKHKDPKAS